MVYFLKSLLVVMVSILAGCAGSVGGVVAPKSVPSDEEQVKARAEARWVAMMAKDFEKAYSFLSPGSKAVHSQQLFRGKIRPLDWRSAKAVNAICEADVCRVSISLMLVDERLGGEVTTILEETWLRDSGQWWLVFN